MNDFREYSAAFHAQNYDILHFGILGMKWGVRRYQNEDGTLTTAGKKRYDKAINSRTKTKINGRSWHRLPDYGKAAKKISKDIPQVKEMAKEAQDLAKKHKEIKKEIHDIEGKFYGDSKEFEKACDYVAKKSWDYFKKSYEDNNMSFNDYKKGFTHGDFFQYDEIMQWMNSGKSKYGKEYKKTLEKEAKAWDEYTNFLKKSMKGLDLNQNSYIDMYKFRQMLESVKV